MMVQESANNLPFALSFKHILFELVSFHTDLRKLHTVLRQLGTGFFKTSSVALDQKLSFFLDCKAVLDT